MTVADVYINIPVKSIARAFTYLLPPELSQVGAGWRVFVPFGKVRVEGFVVAVRPYDAARDAAHRLRAVLAAVDEEAWFSPALLVAARELADFYLCSLAEMMRLFMPGKSGLRIFPVYEAEAANEGHPVLADSCARTVYDFLLRKGGRRIAELRRALPDVPAEETVEKLLRYRIISKEYHADRRDRARYEKYYSAAEALTEEHFAALTRKPAQARALRLFADTAEPSAAVLKEAGVTRATIKHLLAANLIVEHRRRKARDSYGTQAETAQREVPLTAAQAHAADALREGIAAGIYRGYLLHGVTGSGKTRVYIETARAVRARGRQVVVLVPEIALTGQLITAFQEIFAGDIVVMHSRLSLAERNDAIFRVRCGEAGIIIGARSALFVPADNIGCIILDEEQDMSYKQDESPRSAWQCDART